MYLYLINDTSGLNIDVTWEPDCWTAVHHFSSPAHQPVGDTPASQGVNDVIFEGVGGGEGYVTNREMYDVTQSLACLLK